MKRRQHVFAGLALALTLCVGSAAQAAPQSISFTGNLTDESGGAVATAVNITARIFNNNNELLWQETHNGVQPTDGLVFLELGSVDRTDNALDTTVFDGGGRFLELEVDGDVLSPRLALLSVPYATHAEYSEKTGEATFAKDAEFAENAGALDGVSASEFSRTSHNHDGDYAAVDHGHTDLLPKGTLLSCSGTQKMRGLTSAGNVVCADDMNSATAYSAGSGLSLSGSNQFSLASGGVTASHIATNAVNSSEIASSAVTNLKLASNAVTSSKIASSAVTSSKIGSNAVTSSKIATGAVTSSDIADGTITGTDIASNTITRSDISGEIRLYTKAAGCGGGMTTSSTCKTIVAGILPPTPVGQVLYYFSCSGTATISYISPQTCSSLSTAGWMLKN